MLRENYKGYDLILITNGEGNLESWYSISKDGRWLVHWFIRGRIYDLEPVRRVVDSMHGTYPKMMMNP